MILLCCNSLNFHLDSQLGAKGPHLLFMVRLYSQFNVNVCGNHSGAWIAIKLHTCITPGRIDHAYMVNQKIHLDAITRARYLICSLHDDIPVSDKGCVTLVGKIKLRTQPSQAGSLSFPNNQQHL